MGSELRMGFIQLCSIVFLALSVSAFELTGDNYSLTVTSSAPSILGSLIHFKAVVLGSQSKVPQPDTPFCFEWTSNVFVHDVETTWANESSSIVRCYKTKANTYRMNVDLWQYVSRWQHIGSNYVEFNITDSLNGYLNATQKTGFIKQTRREYIFSTKEPVQLFVNVTDSFRSPPTMIYDWYIDDKVLETHNVPRLVHEFNKTGRHTIKAVAKVNTEGYEDCNGLRYEKDPNGTFYVTVHMKDPVGTLFMLGNQTVQLGQGINLIAIWQDGSPPFNFTWVLREENGEMVLNRSSQNLMSTSSNISLSAGMLPTVGRYHLVVYVENDVSRISYQQLLTVQNEKTVSDPENSPYTVVFAVIGGLVTMTIIVLVFVKVRQYRESQRHIETADFDFHPNLSSSYEAMHTTGETVSEKLKSLLLHLCKSTDSEPQVSTSGYKPPRRYGTMEGSVNA